jgi:uncharacterized protein (TIRG00374 family)
MRRIIIVIALFLATVFVISKFTELQSILNALRRSNPSFLLVALLFEIVCLFNTAATFSALYRLVGLSEGRWQMFLMTTAANFVNVIVPSGGVGGIAVFLDSGQRRKIPVGRVLVVGVLYLIYEYAALFCIITMGFIVLLKRHDLNTLELVAAGFLVLVALIDVTILVLGYKSSEKLGRLLAWCSKLVNRVLRPFLHRDYLKVENAYTFSDDIAEGIKTIRSSPKNLVWPFLLTLNNKALLLCVLAFTFLALKTPFSMGTLVGGLSVSYLFFYASPTPSGVGFVEGVLPLTLYSLRVPYTDAVLITLAFRGLTIWLAMILGAIAFRLLQRQTKTIPEEA